MPFQKNVNILKQNLITQGNTPLIINTTYLFSVSQFVSHTRRIMLTMQCLAALLVFNKLGPFPAVESAGFLQSPLKDR